MLAVTGQFAVQGLDTPPMQYLLSSKPLLDGLGGGQKGMGGGRVAGVDWKCVYDRESRGE